MKKVSKMPLLLYSYLATEMLEPFFASFLIMNCVFFLVRLIPFLNFVLDLNIGLADFTRLISYMFPNIFLYTIPMAAMMGVTIGFARLSSDSEILAFKASGISMYKIIPPVVIVTALIALFTSYCSTRLIPLSEAAMKQLTYQLLKEKINNGIKPHVFTEALGDVVVYVEDVDKKTGRWSKVWVSDMRDGANPTITMASTGKMISSVNNMNVSIILDNGSLHRPDIANAQVVEFDRYQINIPLQPPDSKATRVKQKNVLSQKELLLEAQSIEGDTTHKRKLLIEFHKRLVLPAGCLLMSLLGLPLGLQARPGKKAIGIQAGLGIFIFYYILFTFGKQMAEDGVLPVMVAMWIPNLLFFLLAVFWVYRIANEQPLLPATVSEKGKYYFTLLQNGIKEGFQLFRTKTEEQQQWVPDDRQPKGLLISGNPKKRQFHLPGCKDYRCKSCTLVFKDVKIALDSGFSPCPQCQQRLTRTATTQHSQE
ncbi:LPS export ABC transporter permease LptF [Desulforhopalus singaporensis]|uniref:Lipopolysaccharide export system permease protein n=1 Tax=Desulforhopalus singaporensis TaxID=91360 RepID=A0A1H0PH81_9BACT|nr:LPS export ABC transporter permease LptF [Desulforhopalus singaporensis]SDP04130.1 lipopolysaccharide export system permease protein [Desulforhopalus singaporensis]